MATAWNSFLDFLYPPRCCSCDSHSSHHGFCRNCLEAIPRPASPMCTVCGVPFVSTGIGENHLCSACLRKRPAFRRARSVATYDANRPRSSPLNHVVHRYKYDRDVTLAPVLADLVRERMPIELTSYDLVVPVPLHSSRLRWRGFNQALLLARQLQKRLPSPAIDPLVLARVRPTRPQIALEHQARKQNVAGAFAVTDERAIHGRRILLIDDVLTTGATVGECSRALMRGGADAVDVLVVARAVLR